MSDWADTPCDAANLAAVNPLRFHARTSRVHSPALRRTRLLDMATSYLPPDGGARRGQPNRYGRASMIVTSNRDTAEWLAMFDEVLLAQSAVDRFRNSAYDFVVDGESYRPKLKPKIGEGDPPPASPAMKPTSLKRRAKRRG